MPLVPLEIPPGVYANGTEMQSSGRWLDSSLVRWIEGTMRPVGGWTAFTNQTLPTTARAAISWRDDAAGRYVAFGSYDRLHSMTASGTLSDITPVGLASGDEDATTNTGYGGGFYGLGTYGTARPESANYSDPTTWSLDTWGNYLVACSDADGKLYEWQLSAATPAAAITNAPTDCDALVVTPERFLMALGAGGDIHKVQWSDREDNTTWTPAATNEAGDILLQTPGRIMLGRRMRGQTLILTDTDAHTATYVGPPFVYGFEIVGTACGAISRRCAAEAEGAVFWMGDGSFFRFAGGVVEEIYCDVADYVFGNITTAQRGKVYAVSNTEFSEIWWFYSTDTENNRYVAYNYKENHWSIGAIDRTCGTDRGVFRDPIWVDASGTIYRHETGLINGAASVYAESGPISIAAGENVMSVTDLYPDEKTQGDVTMTFQTRFYPQGTEYTYGPYTMSAPTSVRFTGRQVRMRVDQSATSDWRVGAPRIEARAMGRR